MRVAVVGTGYVGLVTAVGLAELGHSVVCVDVDQDKVAALERGEPPIYERGLEQLLARNLGVRLRATTDLGAAVAASELTFICVGTPSRPDGGIDVSFVRQAADQVGAALAGAAGWHGVVVKSTVVPGTTDTVVTPALERASGRRAGSPDLGVGVNPEFLTEGQAVDDFLRPDRIVLGGDRRTVAALRALYAGFQAVPIVQTSAPTAEMIKYAANALLATAISFSNEIANLGAAIGGIDVVEVMRGVHLSRYLTTPLAGGGSVTAPLSSFLEAGCGYGGSCLPKDVAALAARGREVGSPMRLLEAVAQVNDEQPARLVELLERRLGSLAGRRVTVLGLAFKPDTDDVRSSPAFPVLESLLAAGAEVSAHDPLVGPEALAHLGEVGYLEDLAAAVKQAEAVVIVTRWDHFRQLPELVAQLDPPPLVVDGRRMLERDSVPAYAGIGL
jgi:UDPglucose 6-dehydrogenase